MADSVVTRREIRSLTNTEFNRFRDAFKTMMENKNDVKGTSDFFRIAGYHGEPGDYCHHNKESFPGWHRIYLYDFERALQAADRANGNDGKIAVPYWDWTTGTGDGLWSRILREEPVFRQFPENFWPENFWKNYPQTNPQFKERPVRASDEDVTFYLELPQFGILAEARDCILNAEHWKHSTKSYQEWAEYASIESPHDSIHGVVGSTGGQLGAVAWASFDIVFWLHHCNVDRQYELYLSLEPDSQQEFQSFQEAGKFAVDIGEMEGFEWLQNLEANQQKNVNHYEAPLTPFKKENGDDFFIADTFNTKDLGYEFDELPPAPTLDDDDAGQPSTNSGLLRAPPTVAIFENVKLSEFDSKCYMVHVFVYDKNEDQKEEINDIKEHRNSPNYAGGFTIFARGAGQCSECVKSGPVNFIVDITENIRQLKISRYDVECKVYALETTVASMDLISGDDIPALPKPRITGPLFENIDDEKDITTNKNNVEALQRYLQRYGYYDKEQKIDGEYGKVTKLAVQEFQKAVGIKEDGIAGPKTRNAIVSSKRCANLDPFASNSMDDKASDLDKAKFRKKAVLTYKIGKLPGYLKQKRVSACIEKVCKQYSDCCDGKITFKETSGDGGDDSKEDIDIRFDFVFFKSNNNVLKNDGPGGILGFGEVGFVHFDLAERWICGDIDDEEKQISDINDPKTWRRGQPLVSLYYVGLHELGHSLGMKHSMNVNDVMSPWYNPKQTKLSDNDKNKFNEIVETQLLAEK